jgi:hypothetical protein
MEFEAEESLDTLHCACLICQYIVFVGEGIYRGDVVRMDIKPT